MLDEPARGPTEHVTRPGFILSLRFTSEGVAQQAVAAVPLPLAIESDDGMSARSRSASIAAEPCTSSAASQSGPNSSSNGAPRISRSRCSGTRAGSTSLAK